MLHAKNCDTKLVINQGLWKNFKPLLPKFIKKLYICKKF